MGLNDKYARLAGERLQFSDTVLTPIGTFIVEVYAATEARIYDACSLGGAEIFRFRHTDAKDLERRLVRLGERADVACILVEGIYSMLGDVQERELCIWCTKSWQQAAQHPVKQRF